MRAALEHFSRGYMHAMDYLRAVAGNIDIANIQSALNELARAIERAETEWFPANVLGVRGPKAGPIITLASEGITVWTVPRTEITALLMHAQTPEARRLVLDEFWAEILDDCAAAIAGATGGPYADLALLLEEAITILRSGHVAASQTLAASVLDTLTRVGLPEDRRRDFLRQTDSKNRKRMNHFEDLDLPTSMVIAPIWLAYRSQETPAEREASTSFARNATAHHLRGDQVSLGNATQAIMLATALLDLLGLFDSQVAKVAVEDEVDDA